MKFAKLIILLLLAGGSSIIYRMRLFLTILCMLIVFSPVWSRAELNQSIDSEALEILKGMSDYLSSQQIFGLQAFENEEVVLDDGQKIMSSREIRFQMARPNKFHAQINDGESELEMFNDSSSFTLFRKDLKYFATTTAPPSLPEVFAKLEDKLNIQVVAQDILRDDSYKFLLTSVISGFVVGDALVHGVLCTQLAFRLTDTDMQIWITKDEQPLPMKYVVTSRWITGAPQYTITFLDWTSQDDIDNTVFIFKAPKDAKEITFAEDN